MQLFRGRLDKQTGQDTTDAQKNAQKNPSISGKKVVDSLLQKKPYRIPRILKYVNFKIHGWLVVISNMNPNVVPNISVEFFVENKLFLENIIADRPPRKGARAAKTPNIIMTTGVRLGP